MAKSHITFSIIFISLLILLVPSASAVGLSGPFKPSFTYEPGMEINLTYLVINSAAGGMNISTSIEADPNYCCSSTSDATMQIIDQNSKLSFRSQYFEGGEGKPLNVYLKLPDKIDAPGMHAFLLRATELGVTGTGIGAVASVRTPIFIFVRYPGKHVDAGLHANDIEEGAVQKFAVRVTSRGTSPVSRMFATITVYDSKNETVATLDTNADELPIDTTRELVAEWDTKGRSEGEYTAVANLNYDGLSLTSMDKFKIGALNLKILNYTREVTAGIINPFEVQVESKWNDVISNVYAVVDIKKGNEILSTFQTPSTDVQPWSTKTVSGYFNANVPPGEYDVNVGVMFSGKQTSIPGKLTVVEQKLSKLSNVTLPIIIFAALIILNLIIWIAFAIKRRKNAENQPENRQP